MTSTLRSMAVATASASILVALVAGACSVTSSSDGRAGGSCPCDVGNAGIHMTIPCGGAQCVTLNGTVTGYRCGADGATVDPTVCEPGSGGGGGGGACVPKSCADQGFTCGTVSDTCGASIVCPACGADQYCSETNHCVAHAENVAIFGNLQGGTFGIEVDADIPKLGIGLIANSVMNVAFSGPYVGNVVAVYMVVNEGPGTVTGIPQSLVVWHRVPKATLDAGFSNMVLDCETPSSQTPTACNPPAQVEDFFTKTLGGKLLFNDCQVGPFTGTLLVSAGGGCP